MKPRSAPLREQIQIPEEIVRVAIPVRIDVADLQLAIGECVEIGEEVVCIAVGVGVDVADAELVSAEGVEIEEEIVCVGVAVEIEVGVACASRLGADLADDGERVGGFLRDEVGELDAGDIAGAALDVMAQEPPGPSSPLYGRDNVIITPHTSFYSEESLVDLQTKAAEEVVAILGGKAPRNPVNPEVVQVENRK